MDKNMHSHWMGQKGFDEAQYYNDETYEIGLLYPDQLIKEKILKTFSRHPSLSVANITVSVSNGFVSLEGTVQSLKEKSEAAELACGSTGVKAVKNDLLC